MATKTIEQKLKERVSLGAKFLDIINPKWEKQIDLSELDLGQPNTCMIGELYGDYSDGILGIGLTDDSATTMGFYAKKSEHYPLLTRIWKNLIKSRLRK